MTPIVEKRLDFRLHKNVNALIQEIQLEIQDSYFQIFKPAPQELEYTQTKVYNEDNVSREYITFEGTSPGLLNTQEPILNVNFRLDTTILKQERTVFDSFELAGDLGGLNEVLFLSLTPLVGFVIGKRYSFSLLSDLFWVSDQDEAGPHGSGT